MELHEDFRTRSALVLGDAAMAELARATVAVFGLGGVGAACALDLVRVGIGSLVVFDHDTVQQTNLNRLAIGFLETIGLPKVQAFAQLAHRINPEVQIVERSDFLSGIALPDFPLPAADAYVDCIDSLNSKVQLIALLVRSKARFVSSMGMGGRLDPSRLHLGNLWDSSGCPLAREVRNRLRRIDIGKDSRIPCVWSDEAPAEPGPYPALAAFDGDEAAAENATENAAKVAATHFRSRRILGSTPFVPQAAGHLLASAVARALLGDSV